VVNERVGDWRVITIASTGMTDGLIPR
jgi:hypothetical protein